LVSAVIGNALLLENVIHISGNRLDGPPVLQVTLSSRVNPAIRHSLVTHTKLRAALLPMKGAKSNDWSLSAEGPLLRVGQGHLWLVQKHARSSLFSQRLHLLHPTGFLILRPGFHQEGRAFFMKPAVSRSSLFR
jgi:hypothetical protein